MPLDGKLHISPIMDCFNGEIIALQMGDNIRKGLCIDTLKLLMTDSMSKELLFTLIAEASIQAMLSTRPLTRLDYAKVSAVQAAVMVMPAWKAPL